LEYGAFQSFVTLKNSPYEHAMYYVSYRLQDVLWHSNEKIQVLVDGISVVDMRKFIGDLFERTHCEMFIHGNYTREHAESFASIIEKGLGSKPLAPALRFRKSRMAVIEAGKTLVVQEIVRNPENLNSAIGLFLN
jgi:insulysin